MNVVRSESELKGFLDMAVVSVLLGIGGGRRRVTIIIIVTC